MYIASVDNGFVREFVPVLQDPFEKKVNTR